MVHGTWAHEESTWVRYTWVCGTGLHMRGCRELEVKSGVYLEYLKLCHGTWGMRRAHECITHGCVAQGCQELEVKTGVYLEYLKLCLKLYRKLSIHLTHIPDLLIEQ